MLKPLWRLLFPGLLLMLALYLVFDVGRIQQQYQPLLVYLPYPLLLLAMLLAQQFNRLRLFAAAGLFLLTFAMVQTGLQQSLAEPKALSLYTGLSLLLPINMLLLAALPERDILIAAGASVALDLVLPGIGWLLLPSSSLQIPFEYRFLIALKLFLIHICRCRRTTLC